MWRSFRGARTVCGAASGIASRTEPAKWRRWPAKYAKRREKWFQAPACDPHGRKERWPLAVAVQDLASRTVLVLCFCFALTAEPRSERGRDGETESHSKRSPTNAMHGSTCTRPATMHCGREVTF